VLVPEARIIVEPRAKGDTMVGSPPTVLIVDADPTTCAALQGYLDTGYTCVIASTAAAARALCRATQPDALLLSDRLPDSDGLALLDELKGEHGALAFAIVLLHDTDDRTVAAKALERGVHVCPIRQQDIGPCLAHVLAAVVAQLQLQRQNAALQRRLESDERASVGGNPALRERHSAGFAQNTVACDPAHEQLHAWQERLQLATVAANIGTFIWYPAEDRGEPDEQMIALFGLAPGGTLTLAAVLATMIHPEDRERYAKAAARASDPDGSGWLREDIRVMQADGTERCLAITGRTTFADSEPRQAIRMAGIAVDITERKRVEDALRQSERRTRFLVQLGEATRTLLEAKEIIAVFARLLREHLGADRVAYAEVEADEDHFVFAGDSCAPGVPSIAGRYPVSAFGGEALRAMRQGQAFVASDAEAELPEKADRLAYQRTGIRALIAAPLHKNGRFVAGMGVHMLAQRRWRSEEIELVQIATEQCWVSIERARAEAELRESEARLQLALDAAKMGTFLWHIEDDRGELDAQTLALFRLTPNDSPNLARLAAQFHPDDRAAQAQATAQALDPAGDGTLRSEVRVGHPDGTVRWLAITAQSFFAGEPRRAVRMSGVVADITERKHAEQDLLSSRQRIRKLSARLINAYEDERRTLAAELHDEIGQHLTALKILLETDRNSPAEPSHARLREAQGLIENLTKQVRQLSLDLRPSMLDDLGLLPTLLWHIELYSQRTSIAVDFKYSGLDIALSPQVAIAAYRTVQEGLTNIARHAGTASAAVRVWASAGQLKLAIEDHGRGFDAAAIALRARSVGLASMRERAELLGGQFSLDSTPGEGTYIRVTLPLDVATADVSNVE
jgi:signal transduction histidine kinase/DNA-binding response OmpR family regulator